MCESCIDLSATGSGSIDVIELDAASHGGVMTPVTYVSGQCLAQPSPRYKVYIIDEAHMISPAGFNALLKLVEEPPEHVRIYLRHDRVRQSSGNYSFSHPQLRVPASPGKDPARSLGENLCSEGIPADPAALALIARAGAGSVRDSLSILGQVISGSRARRCHLPRSGPSVGHDRFSTARRNG